MARLDPLIRKVQAVAACPGFFRRDRSGQALFVSDFPRRVEAAQAQEVAARLTAASWQVQVDPRGMAFLSPGFSVLSAFLQALPQPAPQSGAARLVHSLLLAQGDQTAYAPALFLTALLLWDAGQEEQLLRLMGRTLAVCKREGTPFPALLLPLCPPANDKEIKA